MLWPSYPWCPLWGPAVHCRRWRWPQRSAAGPPRPPLASWSLLPCCWTLPLPDLDTGGRQNTTSVGTSEGETLDDTSLFRHSYLPMWHSGVWCQASSWLVHSSAHSVTACGGAWCGDVSVELVIRGERKKKKEKKSKPTITLCVH